MAEISVWDILPIIPPLCLLHALSSTGGCLESSPKIARSSALYSKWDVSPYFFSRNLKMYSVNFFGNTSYGALLCIVSFQLSMTKSNAPPGCIPRLPPNYAVTSGDASRPSNRSGQIRVASQSNIPPGDVGLFICANETTE